MFIYLLTYDKKGKMSSIIILHCQKLADVGTVIFHIAVTSGNTQNQDWHLTSSEFCHAVYMGNLMCSCILNTGVI